MLLESPWELGVFDFAGEELKPVDVNIFACGFEADFNFYAARSRTRFEIEQRVLVAREFVADLFNEGGVGIVAQDFSFFGSASSRLHTFLKVLSAASSNNTK